MMVRRHDKEEDRAKSISRAIYIKEGGNVMTYSYSKGRSTRSESLEIYIDGSYMTSLSPRYAVLY